MTKKECFFVWRTNWSGVPCAVVLKDAEESRLWLQISIEETDPFQGMNLRRIECFSEAVAS